MARYMETAAEANEVAKKLLELMELHHDPTITTIAAELIARLYNLGIRTAPRAVQSTVRYNAVKRAVQDLPVRVSMEQRRDERTLKTYNVLITQPLGGTPTTETANGLEPVDEVLVDRYAQADRDKLDFDESE